MARNWTIFGPNRSRRRELKLNERASESVVPEDLRAGRGVEKKKETPVAPLKKQEREAPSVKLLHEMVGNSWKRGVVE